MARTTKRKTKPDGTLGSLAPGTWFGIGNHTGRVAWVSGETVFVRLGDSLRQYHSTDSIDWSREHDYEYMPGGDLDPLK